MDETVKAKWYEVESLCLSQALNLLKANIPYPRQSGQPEMAYRLVITAAIANDKLRNVEK